MITVLGLFCHMLAAHNKNLVTREHGCSEIKKTFSVSAMTKPAFAIVKFQFE